MKLYKQLSYLPYTTLTKTCSGLEHLQDVRRQSRARQSYCTRSCIRTRDTPHLPCCHPHRSSKRAVQSSRPLGCIVSLSLADDDSGECSAAVSNLQLACIGGPHSSIALLALLLPTRLTNATPAGAPAHERVRAWRCVAGDTSSRVCCPCLVPLGTCTMCSLKNVCFGRRAARQVRSATCGETKSIGTTCSAYQRSGCNGHVRLKGGRIARIRAMRRQMAIDAEGRAVWSCKTVVGRGV